MKKIIVAFSLCILLFVSQLISFATEPSSVTAIDGNVTIFADVDAPDGTPVLIFILPAIFEGENDVTVAKVQGLTTESVLGTLNVEYITLEYVSSGKVTHNCVMKDSLTTGLCHVVFNYFGAEDGCYSVGTFEHVGENDKAVLLNALNAANKDTCGPIIDKDINGVIDTDGETVIEEAKEILRKSSADVTYYNTLGEEKEKFYELLYNLKASQNFDLPLLIECFNKAGVWMKLSLEEDTLGVLRDYNGTGIGKYWNIAVGDDSDFASLSGEEKSTLLTKIKRAGYLDKDSLETDFHNGVMMAMFRSATTREELASLINENKDENGNELNIYADGFAKVREIITNANLNEYKLALLYNDILDKNSNSTTIEDIEILFSSSIIAGDYDDNAGGGGEGGGGGGSNSGSPMGSNDGYGIKYDNDIVVSPPQPDIDPFPFTDVEPDNWAYSYVKKLHQDNVINGISADKFAPSASVARQDFVKILIGSLGIEATETKSHFSDVADDSYYTAFVMKAFQEGIITGISKDCFGVGISIKREDAAVIMDRVLTKYGKEITEIKPELADSEKASDYATESIARVVSAGIFSGDENGNFNPKENLSRAEACAILYRLAELIKEV